jgi:hypothetical protein
MIQAPSPDGANEALDERILSRALGRREDLLDPQALHAAGKGLAENLVAITQQVRGCGVVRERTTLCRAGWEHGRSNHAAGYQS